MLSVVIETRNDEEGLARTLASLVGAAVEGVVRDVTVCDGGSTDQTRRVAEHAGCHFIEGGAFPKIISAARGEWLLLLEPGARPVEGWTETVLEHVASHQGPACLTESGQRRLAFLSRLFGARRALSSGLILRKEDAIALLAGADSAEALARRARSTKLAGLIRPALRSQPR
jgi:glycosyltransferase involved in cell wall biosynthesis